MNQDMIAKFKPLEEQTIKEGIDCLEKHMGWLEARHFLNVYHNKRNRDNKGRDYTKWKQDHTADDEDISAQELLDVVEWKENLHAVARS
jgi:hypothetical protein